MDLRLLKGTLNRTTYNLLNRSIPRDLVSADTTALLRWQRAFFKSYPEVQDIDPQDLHDYVVMRNEGNLEDAGVKVTLALIDKLHSTPTEDSYSLYEHLLELQLAGEAGKLVLDYQSGGDVDIIAELSETTRKYATLKGVKVQETSDIGDILDGMMDNSGVIFEGVPMFEEYFTPITWGESIAVAGRPDRGKTTLLSFMLSRAIRSTLAYGGEKRPILWLVNEGHQDKILPRIYQAVLGITLTEMFEMRRSGTLIPEYESKLGTSKDYIKVIPIHGKTIQDVEMLVQQYNPSLVIIDMVEHLRGVYGGSKTEVIGATWEAMRTMALMYNFIHIGTAQISAEGADELYPDYSHIAYTKTALQGYTDRIIMLGNRETEGWEHIRGLSTPKNKGKVEAKSSYPRIQFEVDFDRCQFYQMA